MATVRAATPRARYQSRPGRGVLVADRLADLQGPVQGLVELPVWMYQIVLREASRPEDLTYLNGERLVAVWPELYLPKGVRQAWEDQHPELHAAPVPAI